MDAKTAAAAAGISGMTLYAWLQRDQIPGLSQGTQGRRRDYSVNDATNIAMLATLARLGLSLSIAKEIVARRDAWNFVLVNPEHRYADIEKGELSERERTKRLGALEPFYGGFNSPEDLPMIMAMHEEADPGFAAFIVVDVKRIRTAMMRVEQDDPHTMANLCQTSTGLPMVVWVSERGNAQHDARVKVCRVHGDTIQSNNTASVAVRPQPHLAAGTLSQADLDAVSRWIRLNADPIVDYWDGNIDTIELTQRLRPLNPPIAIQHLGA